MLAITWTYFLPELGAITHTPFSTVADPALTSRAKTWEMLSLVRLAFMVLVAVVLLTGLSRSEARSVHATETVGHVSQ